MREAHALDSSSPTDFALVEDAVTLIERAETAGQCVADLDLPMPALLDKMDNAVEKAYKGHPDRLYLIGKDGKIAYAGGKGPFGFKPEELVRAIDKELSVNKSAAKPAKGSSGDGGK